MRAIDKTLKIKAWLPALEYLSRSLVNVNNPNRAAVYVVECTGNRVNARCDPFACDPECCILADTEQALLLLQKFSNCSCTCC